jgi:hypothetical protein
VLVGVHLGALIAMQMFKLETPPQGVEVRYCAHDWTSDSAERRMAA